MKTQLQTFSNIEVCISPGATPGAGELAHAAGLAVAGPARAGLLGLGGGGVGEVHLHALVHAGLDAAEDAARTETSASKRSIRRFIITEKAPTSGYYCFYI